MKGDGDFIFLFFIEGIHGYRNPQNQPIMNTKPLIENIYYLETYLGNKNVYPILEPFSLDSSELPEVRKAAKRIAGHLGMTELSFIVSYVDSGLNSPTQVDLNGSKHVVKIKIDDRLRKDYDMVLAKISREICYNYLRQNKIHRFSVHECDKLVDVASVYIGLGKLSLNGCEKEFSPEISPEEETPSTNIKMIRIGHLSRQQFAFCYKLICNMRRVPETIMMSGLNNDAAAMVRGIVYTDKNYFGEKNFVNDFILKEFSVSFKESMNYAQKYMSELDKNIRIIKNIILPYAESLSNEFHAYTKSHAGELNVLANRILEPESFNYIKNVLLLENLELYKNNILEKEDSTKRLRNILASFIDFVSKSYNISFSGKNKNLLLQFECPFCQHRMKINRRVRARVHCRKCNYSFIIDARFLGNEVNTPPEEKVTENNFSKKSANKSILSLFKLLFK